MSSLRVDACGRLSPSGTNAGYQYARCGFRESAEKGGAGGQIKETSNLPEGARWIESFTGKKKTNAEKENVMET